ncbi:MAG: ABC transporter substrate-binding protein [Acidimicrobiales bacterium]
MLPRQWIVRWFIVCALAAGTLVAFTSSVPSSAGTSAPLRTLTLSLPGPLNGCTVLDKAATPTTGALLDLIRPSAFLTSPSGNLYGEGGPIASAELVSLKPETVVYTIAPNQHWSNGDPFDGVDLVAWWLKAKALASVQSDGYRLIKSMTETNNGLSVKATFSSPFAEWNLLFRDVENVGSPSGCSWTDFMRRPSLGPYKVVSASARRIVLVNNPAWASLPNRFGRLIVTDATTLPTTSSSYYASYSLQVTRSALQAVSSRPSILSHIGTSSNIEEITFAPARRLTRQLKIREALSWSLNRQALINRIFGAVTFSASVAQSALYSQGQGQYPGAGGNGPSAQSTTTTLNPSSTNSELSDCPVCAAHVLVSAGYHKSGGRWTSPVGVPLSILVAEGHSNLDRVVAQLVAAQWRAFGIGVRLVGVSSDIVAASDAATNHVDAAVFARPTTTTAWFAARSWSGPAYPDSYPSGIRSAAINRLFSSGVTNFNPVSASSTWLQLDQTILTSYRVRPLFTAPSLVEWSNSVGGVYGSLSVPGFADEVTSWGTSQLASAG